MTKIKLCIECNIKPKYKAHARCHECYKKHRMANRDVEKTNRQNRESLARNYIARRKYVYKTRYKMSEEQYQKKLAEQNYSCAICGTHISELTKRLSVDHDHNCCPALYSCGSCIRGLLCGRCNMSLGGFKDNRGIIVSALNYLNFYSNKGDDQFDESQRCCQ